MSESDATDFSNQLELRAGDLIGEVYEVVELLSSGASGHVYKVRHTVQNSFKALKILRLQQRAAEDSVKRLHREAQVLCRLSHPNVVKVEAVSADSKVGIFLVMEFLEGPTLDALLKERHLKLSETFKIAPQLCAGLQAAHDQGILHRDLKPSNIMLVPEDGGTRAVLIDFGVAKMMDSEQHLTRTAAILGTPLYMSPEQCRGDALDVRSDVYAMGCVLYQMLTGKPPYSGETSFTILTKHLYDPAPSVVLRNPTGQPHQKSLNLVVQKAMSKDPSERYQSVAELLADIENVTRGQQVSVIMPALQPTAKKPLSRAALKKIAALVLLLAVSYPLSLLWIETLAPADVQDWHFERQFEGLVRDEKFEDARKLAAKMSEKFAAKGDLPHELHALQSLAFAMSNIQPLDVAAVEAVYAKAHKLSADQHMSTFNIDMEAGDFLFNEGQSALACRYYEPWLEHPENPSMGFDIAYRVAEAKFSQGQISAVEKPLKIAESQVSNEVQKRLINGLRGSVLVNSGQYSAGLRPLNNAIKDNFSGVPMLDMARFYAHLSLASRKLGDFPKAGWTAGHARLISAQVRRNGRRAQIKGEVEILLLR